REAEPGSLRRRRRRRRGVATRSRGRVPGPQPVHQPGAGRADRFPLPHAQRGAAATAPRHRPRPQGLLRLLVRVPGCGLAQRDTLRQWHRLAEQRGSPQRHRDPNGGRRGHLLAVSMYRAFFGLGEAPFRITPDPRFLHHDPVVEAALQTITTAIAERAGLVLLVGEVGTGKTTLVRHLLETLPE